MTNTTLRSCINLYAVSLTLALEYHKITINNIIAGTTEIQNNMVYTRNGIYSFAINAARANAINSKSMIQSLIIFLFVGSATVLIDYAFYNLFVFSFLIPINIAKALSFIIGTIFGYLMNRLFTFGGNTIRRGSVLRFIIVYSLAMGINVTSNAYLLDILGSLTIAYIIATGMSATFNFVGMKYFVFSEKKILRT